MEARHENISPELVVVMGQLVSLDMQIFRLERSPNLRLSSDTATIMRELRDALWKKLQQLRKSSSTKA